MSTDTNSYRTDWLGMNSVFYHEKTGAVSDNILEVINFDDFSIHPEGLHNYLDFGYSVFEQTPVKNVKFLRHSAELTVDSAKNINITYLDDPVEGQIRNHSSKDAVLGMIEESVQEWEASTTGDIVVPMSGGYDSRLLAYFINDRSRVQSYTYGISPFQHHSYEVVYAEKVADILDVSWRQIPLGDCLIYLDDWINMYGPSVHAHGMHELEFFEKISEDVPEGNPLLSGIIGDVWAGLTVPQIETKGELPKLGYTHGLNADSTYCRLETDYSIRKQYFESHQSKLQDSRWRVVESMRRKMRLLKFLFDVPKHYGFEPWSPFLDIEIAIGMLTLPADQRKDRDWQREFFKSKQLDVENMNLSADFRNTLDFQCLKQVRLEPLNEKLLENLFESEYVRWINDQIQMTGVKQQIKQLILDLPVISLAGRALDFNEQMRAYNAYRIIKPVEEVLRRAKYGSQKC